MKAAKGRSPPLKRSRRKKKQVKGQKTGGEKINKKKTKVTRATIQVHHVFSDILGP